MKRKAHAGKINFQKLLDTTLQIMISRGGAGSGNFGHGGRKGKRGGSSGKRRGKGRGKPISSETKKAVEAHWKSWKSLESDSPAFFKQFLGFNRKGGRMSSEEADLLSDKFEQATGNKISAGGRKPKKKVTPPSGLNKKRVDSSKDTATLDRSQKPLKTSKKLVAQFDKVGPGDTGQMAKELGLQTDLKAFNNLNKKWTQGADSSVKGQIVESLKTNPDVRALTLYDMYSSQSKGDTTFSEWAKTPQTLFRGGGRSDDFMSFSTSESVAKDASKSNDIARITVKPSDLLGSGASNEVYIESDRIGQYSTKSQ